jgi:hypothetical protein
MDPRVLFCRHGVSFFRFIDVKQDRISVSKYTKAFLLLQGHFLPRQKVPPEIAGKSRDSPQRSTGYTTTCLNAARLPAIAVAVYWPSAISLLAA